jgi:hypothetical protein
MERQERLAVAKLFSGAAGMRLLRSLSAAPAADRDGEEPGTFEPGEGLALPPAPTAAAVAATGGPSAAERARIQAAIAAATSMEEVARLEALLRAGRAV